MPTRKLSPALEQAIRCSDGMCGHNPQLDCDLHHPNPVLVEEIRRLWGQESSLEERAALAYLQGEAANPARETPDLKGAWTVARAFVAARDAK